MVAMASSPGFQLSVCASALACIGCSSSSPPSAEPTEVSRQPVIYGTDDRREFYDIEPPSLRDFVRRNSIALVASDQVMIADGNVSLAGPTWSTEFSRMTIPR